MLYNENYASMMLGCLCNNTEILFNPSYPLSKADFSPVLLHKIILSVIISLAEQGAKEVGEIEIDTYLQAFPVEYETFIDSNGLEFVSNIKSLPTVGSYEMYWNIIRKFSLLRQLKKQGISIEEFYDEAKPEESEAKRLEKLSIQDILSAVEAKTTKLRNRYDVHYVRDEIKAGEDVEERLEEFEKAPSFGAFLQSKYLTTIFNGWSRGHLGLRGGASGVGKSRLGVADLIQVGATQLWDKDTQDFIDNPNYQSPTCFIATEQKIDTEVEPMFWSAVAQVEYIKIINGQCNKEERNRVLKAGEIIKDSSLTITSMPNFTSKNLERKIKQMSESGVQYMVFDYMEQQADISQEYKTLNGSAGRQDQVLLYLATALKQYAEAYNVGILSAQQLSDVWKSLTWIDETALAGGKATKNKIDWGSIIVPTSYLKKPMKIIEPLLKRKGYGENRQPLPNICETIFKSRYGVYGGQKLRVWSYFDRGTFNRTDYFVTDEDDRIVNIPLPKQEDF